MTDLHALAAEWDAVVVGAGPAGAASATLLADRGWRVLLVEKSKWPRDKTCGGCINADAIAMLRRMKLQGVLRGTTNVSRVQITRGGDRFHLHSQGVAVNRAELDQRLVERAVSRGVTFLNSTSAKLFPSDVACDRHRQSPAALPRTDTVPERQLMLSQKDLSKQIRTRLVLACDGINGTLLKDESWARWSVSRRAWMGVSCHLESDAASIARDAIEMNIGERGYVGLVRLPQGRVHVGAALDARTSRKLGGPAKHVQNILQVNGVDVSLNHLHGTGLLTRHRKMIGGPRVLCVGDACGYVEPFTGEGIAWALASAEAVVSLVPPDLGRWPGDLPARWKRLHRRTIGRRQRICMLVRFAVRRPMLWRVAAAVARRWPNVAKWIAPQPTLQRVGETHD